jgi:hypothetical protein
MHVFTDNNLNFALLQSIHVEDDIPVQLLHE